MSVTAHAGRVPYHTVPAFSSITYRTLDRYTTLQGVPVVLEPAGDRFQQAYILVPTIEFMYFAIMMYTRRCGGRDVTDLRSETGR